MADSKRGEVLAVAIAFSILSWVTVSLRIWVRAGMLKSFGSDDWTMIATQVVFTLYLSCQLGGVYYGTGQHLSAIEPWAAQRALRFWFFCEALYILATMLLKVAIGLFLLRVAQKPLHIWIIRIVMLSTIIFGGGFEFVIIFQCSPVSTFWSLDPHKAQCITWHLLSALTYTISALNCVADWTFAILPIFVVKGLIMSDRQKILVSGILALAAVASAATIVRMPYIHTFSQSFLGRDGDFLYDTVGLAIWTTIEVGVGITAGCIATLRPLLQLALSKIGVSSSHQNAASRRSGLPRFPAHSPGLPLDGMAPGHGVITTITGHHGDRDDSHWHSRGSSQEQLSPMENIMKSVVVEYGEVESYSPPSSKLDETTHVHKR
ncbi:hypothetical protein LTR36_006055 [Oleoguttula mirabilis]|uniref:Rhodopsin domain-containing protein n=1 Tax=Oleoguttula mirabilis TaxID=1507867 RepID=A0AAV9JDH6_9PEZI|nr:hypothetical protein LTR36_006055 [Oleoguttula mirabilis]